jgi:hypothetical protein
MEAISELLERAHCVGLSIRIDGSCLIVRGPQAAEGLAIELLNRKAEVMAAFTGIENCGDCGASGAPFSGYCFRCSNLRLFLSNLETCQVSGQCSDPRRWRYADGFRWHCGNCERDNAPRDAVWSRS